MYLISSLNDFTCHKLFEDFGQQELYPRIAEDAETINPNKGNDRNFP
jgi:hypothetical protein